MTRRVLFLDFDGVISSTESWFERRAHRATQLALPRNRVEAAAMLAPPEIHKLCAETTLDEARIYFARNKEMPGQWEKSVRGNVLGDWYSFDPEAVARLDRLVRQAECDVVLSTQWRAWTPHSHMLAELRAHGFTRVERIVGQTPELPYDDRNRPRRTDEIRAWLETQSEQINFVVLDDRCDIVEGLWDRFVNVHGMDGLQDTDVEKALRLFNTI